MSRLYNRQVRVVVAGLSGPGKGWTAPLHIVASVTKDKSAKPNKATIQIYNLNEDSRGYVMSGEAKLVLLYAGYGDHPDEAPLVFKGQIVPKDTQVARNDLDIVLTIEARDGLAEYQGGIISKSWAPGVNSNTVLQGVTGAMGLAMGVLPRELPRMIYQTGYSHVGQGRVALDAILTDLGAEWSIQDGSLQVVMAGQGKSTLAYRIAPGTGLLGTPKVDKKGVEFTAQLNASFAPGYPILLDSKATGEMYVLPSKVVHSINSDNANFTSTITGKEIKPKEPGGRGTGSAAPGGGGNANVDPGSTDPFAGRQPRNVDTSPVHTTITNERY